MATWTHSSALLLSCSWWKSAFVLSQGKSSSHFEADLLWSYSHHGSWSKDDIRSFLLPEFFGKVISETVKFHWGPSKRGIEKVLFLAIPCLFVSPSGIIGAAALDFFNIEISMKIVNQTEEEERTGKKEHIVFLVTQNPLFPCKERKEFSSSSQCLVDSEKQIENQLNKEVF